jgi:UDP-N-acetylglucosamine 1-carboxyvinyltransferase
MDVFRIKGGTSLKGSIIVGGSKNASLPIMAASLLTDDTLTLSNVPNLTDIITMTHLLINHGIKVTIDGANGNKFGKTIKLTGGSINNFESPYEIVRKMRASILVLGPLLAKYKKAKVSLPGGCAIGTRPVDLHLWALEKLGAQIRLEDGYIFAETKGRLVGTEIEFKKISVGATENILMAATLAIGRTIIKNAAMEPEIIDLASCLVSMGAKISGAGTDTIIIDGVDELHGANHTIIPDRIEAGTYAIAAAITGGEIELTGVKTSILGGLLNEMNAAGVSINESPNGIIVKRKNCHINACPISTREYPGFSTDMQAQFMALMSISNGVCEISETIFENRFMHVAELCRMGANIKVNGNIATITGVEKLKSAEVMATDLRASVSLVLAALIAEGESTINRVYHIDRGYEFIEEKLKSCGAQIARIKK